MRRTAAEIAEKARFDVAELVRVFEGSIHREEVMQMAITFMAVVAGLVFSLAVALLAEELIFGQVFRLFFSTGKMAGQAVAVKSGAKALNQKQNRKGEGRCWR
jgi:hypothetical protein